MQVRGLSPGFTFEFFSGARLDDILVQLGFKLSTVYVATDFLSVGLPSSSAEDFSVHSRELEGDDLGFGCQDCRSDDLDDR